MGSIAHTKRFKVKWPMGSLHNALTRYK
uniref:Uncharacterized protein n=1 Tax=Rhizophora mucronata TaxID=61149 RepID=A0A2P2PU73_RHIMU